MKDLVINCSLCNIDYNLYYNTIIEETNSFIIMPGIGALVPGYVLIVTKRHIYSMAFLTKEEKVEYEDILIRYRDKFKKIYGKYPIIFEHGALKGKEGSANSVSHAHSHIMNYNFKEENKIITKLNLKKIDNISNIKTNNYIYYKSPNGEDYITYDFEPISQMMRLLVATELGMKDRYDWHKYLFEENIHKTIYDLK